MGQPIPAGVGGTARQRRCQEYRAGLRDDVLRVIVRLPSSAVVVRARLTEKLVTTGLPGFGRPAEHYPDGLQRLEDFLASRRRVSIAVVIDHVNDLIRETIKLAVPANHLDRVRGRRLQFANTLGNDQKGMVRFDPAELVENLSLVNQPSTGRVVRQHRGCTGSMHLLRDRLRYSHSHRLRYRKTHERHTPRQIARSMYTIYDS